MMKKDWQIINPSPTGNLIQLLLEGRNIKDPVHFLQPLESDMLPYEDLSDIKKAADLVLKAIEEGWYIHILADVDLDGVASNSMLFRYLSDYTNRVSWSINVGKNHGLNIKDLPSYVGKYQLVIAVDSSSDSCIEQKYLIDNGIQVIVLDHHPVKKKGTAIIVNSQLNSYKNPALAGSGVTFKFIKYLDFLQGTTGAEDYYDLAASGIIGDMQDIGEDSKENRWICHKGFSQLINPGLKELVGKYTFNGTCISFSIAPMVNAGVRCKHGELSAQLLLEDDKKKVKKIIEELTNLKEIQNIQKDTLVKDLEIEIEENHMESDKVMGFLISNRDGAMEADITGLVGNVLSAKYDCLVIIVHPTEKEGVLKGSIRGNGIPNFKETVFNTKLVIFCEGHPGAAGISLYKSEWNTLITTLNKQLENTELTIVSNADMILKPKELTMALIKKIEFINMISGTGFKPINIVIEGLEATGITKMKNIHSKFIADTIEFIQWNSDLSERLRCDTGIYKTINVVGTPGISNFMGKTSRQIIINDTIIESHLEFFR